MALLKVCSHNLNRGFTIIELLTVVALMALILGLGLIVSMDSLRGFSFRNDRDAVVAALQRARARAINNVCLGNACVDGKAHGVYFDAGRIVLFQGSDYSSRDEVVDEIIKFESAATTINNSPPNGIVFEQLSGNVNSAVSIEMRGGDWRGATIEINAAGRINY